MLNKPQAVPSPGSAALTEALALIKGIGSGDKNLKKMLENMKEVQKKNEDLYTNFAGALNTYQCDIREFEDSKRKFEDELRNFEEKSRKTELDNELYRVGLEKEKTDLSDAYRSRDTEYQERHGRLIEAEMELTREHDRCAAEGQANENKAKLLSEREAEIYRVETNLYGIQEYLKNHL